MQRLPFTPKSPNFGVFRSMGVTVVAFSNSRIRPELSLWMQAIGGSVREWRGRRELRHRRDESIPPEPQYYEPAVGGLGAMPSLSTSPVAVMVPAPRITGYGRGRRRTALAVAAIVGAAAVPALPVTS